MDSRWMQARRILLVRLDNLGDVLLCTPAFHAVRQTLPEARLTLLASPVGAQVAGLDPDLDDVIVYEAPWMDAWARLEQDPPREQSLIEEIRRRDFDAAIIFTSFRQSPLPSAYLCYLAGVPLRLGASLDGSGSLLTTRHKYQEDPKRHEVCRSLELVAVEGFQTEDLDLVLKVPEGARRSLQERLQTVGLDARASTVVAVHPGCSMPARTYPWEMYSEVADLMVEAGCRVVLTGDASELTLCERVRAGMRREAVTMAGLDTFAEFAALLSLVDLVVTNNTGPAHVASALKTPVVDLFALTNPPEQWGPWRVPHRLLNRDVSCKLCYSRVCPFNQECLRGVLPSEVAVAALELLEETKGGRLVAR